MANSCIVIGCSNCDVFESKTSKTRLVYYMIIIRLKEKLIHDTDSMQIQHNTGVTLSWENMHYRILGGACG